MDFYSFNNMGQGYNRYGSQNGNGNYNDNDGSNANSSNANGYNGNGDNNGYRSGGNVNGNMGYNNYGSASNRNYGNSGNFNNAGANNDFNNAGSNSDFQSKFDEYSGMSEKQLYAELASVVDRMKRDGSFDISTLENLYATSAPFLNDIQRERMKNIIDMLR